MAARDQHQQGRGEGPDDETSIGVDDFPITQSQAKLDEQQSGHTNKGGGGKSKKKREKKPKNKRKKRNSGDSNQANHELLMPLSQIFIDDKSPQGERCGYTYDSST